MAVRGEYVVEAQERYRGFDSWHVVSRHRSMAKAMLVAEQYRVNKDGREYRARRSFV